MERMEQIMIEDKVKKMFPNVFEEDLLTIKKTLLHMYTDRRSRLQKAIDSVVSKVDDFISHPVVQVALVFFLLTLLHRLVVALEKTGGIQ